MSTALMYLAWTALITVLMWIPYTLQLIQGQGLMAAVGNRDNIKPMAPWAERCKRAHKNAVENLVVFAALVLVANATGHMGSAIGMAAMIYFWARVAHYIVYWIGLPWLRTLVWTIGWICLLVIAWQVLFASPMM
ncbi:MAG TPA: MAPEG family protein [bacterium]|nr:MAPEG family protein [bacterium]